MHHPGYMWVRSGIRKPTAFLLAFLLLLSPFTSVFAEELNVAPGQIESTPESNSGPTADGLSGSSLTPNVSDEVPIDSTSDSLTQSETLEKELFDVPPTSSDDASSDSFDLAQLNEKKENGGEEALLQSAAQGGSWGSTGPSNSYPSFTYAPQTPKVEQSTGALTFAVPISIPPGRNGVEPSLSLTYSSQNLEDGAFGYGFRVSIPHIEVINRRGVNLMYSDGYFSSSLSGELGTTTVSNEYRAKIEDGSFLKYTRSASPSGSSWTVTDKKGTTYTFGASAQSRQDNPSNSTQVFKWMLEEIRDTNDNYVRFEYFKDQGEIYPSKIVYTGNGVADGIYTVEFMRTPRPDVRTSYRSGFLVRTVSRITEIQTQSAGTWLRKYILDYASGSNGYRTLLKSVTESGKDEITGVVTTLPPIQFEYAKDPVTYANVSYPMTAPASPAHVISDIDGNGLQDLVISYDENGSTIRNFMEFNNGQGQFPDSTSQYFTNYWGRLYNGPGGFVPEEKGTRFLDVNGDGASDVVQSRYSYITQSFHRSFLLNQNDVRNGGGLGFTAQLDASQFPDFGIEDFGRNSTAGLLGNLNGDGLTDFVRTSSFSVPGGANVGWLNTGSGMVQSGAYVPVSILPMFGFDTVDSRLVDINADGLDDWVFNSADTIKVCFNNGLNWPTVDNCVNSFTIGTTSVDQYGHDKGVRFLDINGDGLVDFVRSYRLDPYVRVGDGAYPAEVANINFVMLNTGSGFATSTYRAADTIVYGAVEYNGTWLEKWHRNEMWDWTGDQIPDAGNVYNTIRTSDVLSKITYPSGGSTSAEYEYTSEQFNKHKRLPFPQLVVKKLITNDGANTLSETQYFYDNGFFYYAGPYDRKFAGFEVITERRPEKLVKTYFHQGDASNASYGEVGDHYAKIGRPYRVDVLDVGTEALMSRSIMSHDVVSQGQNRFYVAQIKTINQQFTGDSTHRDTGATSVFDSTNGNLLTSTNWGEVSANLDGSWSDIGLDSTTEDYTYATGPGITGLVSSQTLKDHSGATAKQSRFYYDGLPLGSVSKGNGTKLEEWIQGGNYRSTTRSYDVFGNVRTETDPRGNTSELLYDSANLRVIETRNPLFHTKKYTNDISSGKPLSVTNENGRVTETRYDGLDRLLETKIPQISNPSNKVTSELRVYTDTPLQNRIEVRRLPSDSIDTLEYIYFDGLGRKMQEKGETEGISNYITRDFIYDSSGRLIRETLPYLSTGSGKSAPTPDTDLHILYTYDALDRVIQVQNVAGQSIVTYDDWLKTDRDQLNNLKSFESDARGNLVKVTEYLDDVPLITTYTYDPNKNLTKLTDSLGNIRSFTYDGLGRRLSAEDLHAPNDTTFVTHTFAYDQAGNMTNKTDGLGRTTLFTYDALNRLLTEDDATATGTEVLLAYDNCADGKAKLCFATSSPLLTSAYIYNPLGLIKSENKTILGSVYPMSFEYDRVGNMTSYVNPDGSEVHYTYDSAGLLDHVSYKKSSASTPEPIVSSLSYAPTRAISSVVYANGVTGAYTFDENELYRLRTLSSGTASAPGSLQNSTYAYDSVGNILSINDTSLTNRRGLSTFTYDDLYRLTSATKSTASTTLFSETYTYNQIGNLLTKSGSGSYSYAQTGYANPHAPTTIGTSTLSYDANGNLLSSGKTKYNWDYRNRLTQWANGLATSTYSYDPSNTRMSQNSGSSTTIYPSKYFTASPLSKTAHLFLSSPQGELRLVGLVTTEFLSTISTSTSTTTATTTTQTATSTGFKSAGTIVQSTGFTNLTPSTVGSSDNTYATSRVSNPVGRLSNFGFAIPANASVLGIEINFEAKRGYGSAVIPFSLSWNSGTSFTATKNKTITASELTHVYGGATDTWGRNWTPGEFSNATFQVKVDPPGSLATLSYDLVRVKVYYGISTTTSTTTTTTTTATTTATTTSALFIHADHLGSTGVVTNASGTATQILDYYPYGSVRIAEGSKKADRQYIGERYDDVSGLNYLNARYYDGSRGQFISQDPVFWGKQNIADPQSLNSYSYTLGNPVNRKDPSGEASVFAALQNAISLFQSLITSFLGLNSGSGMAGGQTLISKRPTVTLSTQGPTKTTTWSSANDKMISKLDARMRQPAINLINETESKLSTRLIVVPKTGGYRSIEEQDAIWQQSQKNLAPGGNGKWLTDLRGGSSYHNYGLAIDVAFVNDKGQYDGTREITKDIGEIGEAQGFEWGGRWTGQQFDAAHFQMTFGQSESELYTKYLNSH